MLRRDTDPESLRQKLLLAESLYEKGSTEPTPKDRNARLIAGNPPMPAAPSTRGGRKTQLVPKPSRAESRVIEGEVADREQPGTASNSGAGLAAPASVAQTPAAPGESKGADKKMKRMESVAGTNAPAAPESVKVIFVMKKTPPAADDTSNPCDDIDA